MVLQGLRFVGMMQYDGDLLLPSNYLVPPPLINHVSGTYLVKNGLRTFACSETQKFGHVTFFWNGNRSGYLDENLETYVEVSWPVYVLQYTYIWNTSILTVKPQMQQSLS